MSRGEDRDDSDVDLLYELEPDAQLGWEIEDLAAELEQPPWADPSTLSPSETVHPALREQRAQRRTPALCSVTRCSIDEMIDAADQVIVLVARTNLGELTRRSSPRDAVPAVELHRARRSRQPSV